MKFRYIPLLFLCLILLISCASQETSEDTPFDLAYDNGSQDQLSYDFNGYTVKMSIVLDSGNGVDVNENILGFNENTIFSDLAYQRIAEVKNDYHCGLELFTNGTRDVFEMNAIVGNADYCDVFMGHSSKVPSWSRAGLLMGMKSTLYEYIDYTDAAKWGRPNQLQAALYKDDLYGLLPAYWPEQNYSSIGYLLIANMNQVLTNGAGDPREMIENQVWNWAAFEEQLVLNTINQGMENAKYGMVTSYPYFAQMICFSNGATTAIVKKDGSYGIGYYESNGRAALDEVDKIWRKELKYTIDPEETWLSEVVAQNFSQYQHGAYAFLPTQFVFGVFGMVEQYLDNYAVLTCPVGPNVEPDFVQAIYSDQNFMINFPTCLSNPEVAATVVNAIYEPLTGFETYDKIREFMNKNYFFDERDGINFFKMYDSTIWNFDSCVYPGNSLIGRMIPCDVCTSSLSVQELLDAYNNIMADFMDLCVKPCYDAEIAVFGEMR